MKALTEPLSPKRAGICLGILIALALLGWSGWKITGRITHRPPSTASVRAGIWRFLRKETGDGDFATDFAVAPASNLLETVTVTNAKGARKTGKLKRSEIGLPETTLTAYFRTNQAQASTYDQMFRLIGQQLKLTEALLDSQDVTQKYSGLVMAGEASAYARNNAMNTWLAARICEGYLWPNLSLVETTNRVPFTPDALLAVCDQAFQDAGETENIIRNYEYLIAKGSSAQADFARFRLARLYADTGREEKALVLLKELKNFKSGKVQQQIANLEQRLKNKK